MRFLRLIAAILSLGLLALPYAIAENYYAPQDRSFHLNNELLDRSFGLTNENLDASFLLESRQPNAPGWVMRGAGPPAVVDCNFAFMTACWVKGYGYVRFTSAFPLTHATTASTNLLSSSASGAAYTTFPTGALRFTPGLGILAEETRTNYFVNSAVPVTQTTLNNLSNGVNYTLWVNGSGSIALSNGTATGCTGTASQGALVNFAPTSTGTCTLTITGSLNSVQLEAGAYPTSLIVTGGAAITRPSDTVQVSSVLLPYFNNPYGSILFASSGCLGGTAALMFNSSGGALSGMYTSFSTTVLASADYNSTNAMSTSLGSGVFSTPFVAGLSWSPSGRVLVGNNGATATNTHTLVPITVSNIYIGSSSGASDFCDGYITRITLFNYQLPTSILKALT
jgi:hypothetical protein